MSIRNVGGTTTEQLDALQQHQSQSTNTTQTHSTSDNLHDSAMLDSAMRQTLPQADGASTKARLQPQFDQSRQDFQAQMLRQQVSRSVPTSSSAASSAAKTSPSSTSTGDITKDPNFTSLSSSQRAIITSAISKNPGNSDLQTQLKTMIDDTRFQKLSTTDRSYTLNGLAQNPGARASDLVSFTSTSSFKGFSGAQRQQGQQIIGLLSSDAALNPSHNPISQNTVNLLVSGNVEMGLPTRSELKKEGFTDADLQGLYGFADGNKMNFNVYMPGLLQNHEDLERTAAHEINHVVNDRNSDTDAVTPERALDEYRAWYVENNAVGIQKPTVAYMKDLYQNFFGPNAGYDNIKEVYTKDPAFHKIIDNLKSDLDAGKVTDPETLRKELAAQIGKDPFIKNPKYLQTPANLDNHIDSKSAA